MFTRGETRKAFLMALLAVFFPGSGFHQAGALETEHDAERGALHVAAAEDSTNLVSVLLAKGSDPAATNSAGWTALHVAAASNAPHVVAMLCHRPPGFLARTPNGYSPLRLAFACDATASAEVLLKRTTAPYDDPCLDARTDVGRQALAATELSAAYRILTKLFTQDPANENINFALGIVCCSIREFGRAQLAFERVLQTTPGNDRARLELAHAYLAGGQPGLATKEFETVLARRPPPSAVKAIEAALREARRGLSRWSWGVRAETGWMNDDNVNVGPDSRTIWIAPILYGDTSISNLTVGESSRPVRADGLFAAVSVSTAYDIGSKETWVVTVDGSYYQNWLSDASEYESLFGLASVGLKRIGARSMTQIPVRMALMNFGHDPLLESYGIAPSYLYACGESGSLQANTSATVEWRNYYRLDDRDGYTALFSEELKQYLGNGGHNISAGVSASYDNARADAYSGVGVSGAIGGELVLPLHVVAYARYRYARTTYAEREPLAPEDRVDAQTQVRVGIGRRTRSWGVDACYQHTVNDSSFQLYQYTRNVVTISLSGAF